MKYKQLFALLLIAASCISCGRNKTENAGKKTKLETKGLVQSAKPKDKNIHTRYDYGESTGAHLIIQNSFPKSGIKYTDANGRRYVYAVFFSRITNKSNQAVELKVDLPLAPFELPSSSNNYMKLLLPPDSLTADRESLYDYGLDVKSFLDQRTARSSSLKKIIKPNESSTFYVVTLSTRGVNGTLRPGFSLKGEDLFYKVNEKEIYCGKIGRL